MTGEPNPLFPVFLKAGALRLLVVGGGKVALEKLNALFPNSPDAQVTLVASVVSPGVARFLNERSVVFREREFRPDDLDGIRVAIAAVNDLVASTQIRSACHERNVLVNVADKPELCDFYLGSVVTKGQLKIAISTNGKSPTAAKRVKETLDEAFPAQIDQLLENLAVIRSTLGGDFASKVDELNRLTESLISKSKTIS